MWEVLAQLLHSCIHLGYDIYLIFFIDSLLIENTVVKRNGWKIVWVYRLINLHYGSVYHNIYFQRQQHCLHVGVICRLAIRQTCQSVQKYWKRKKMFQASNFLSSWQYFLPVKFVKSICTISHQHLQSVNGIHQIMHSPYAFIITFDTTQHCRRYRGCNHETPRHHH